MDILGIFLSLLGILTLLSLLSKERGILTGWWVTTLKQAAGWGTLVLPAALLVIGLWLLFRNVERLPLPSLERIVGILLLFGNLLAWLQVVGGGGWELARAGKGGGYIGALAERGLTSAVGNTGTIMILIAWLIISLVFTLDLSVSDLAHLFGRKVTSIGKPATTQPARLGTNRSTNSQGRSREATISSDLPENFQPLMKTTSGTTSTRGIRGGQTPGKSTPTKITTAQHTYQPAEPVITQPSSWVLPPIEEILDPASPVAAQTNVDQDRARKIEDTLASFGAPVHVVEIQRGPTVTLFGVEPDFIETRTGRTRVRVAKIVSLIDDLSLALAANIRIQAPVPGHGYVGIEVPNSQISKVSLREVIESQAFQAKRSPLRFALGKDVAGNPISNDLAGMPHLLIAGTTGSGKSVCVNSLLCCFLMNNTPDDLRMVLVDPKRVELTGYNGIPHLLAPVVVEHDRVQKALEWILREMDSRFHKFLNSGVRNITEFNTRYPSEKLPYLLVVIDELADLMMMAPEETERAITRLAQLARATGIHLIIATQRPSVDVVTGIIKANFPARIAFAVAAGVDSRVILDQPGAERLLGRGDMLFQAPDSPAPVRLQGCYVSDGEIQRLVDTWRNYAMNQAGTAPTTIPESESELPRGVPLAQGLLWDEPGESIASGDPLLNSAIDLVRREGRASITMLQKRMRIGYTRAARLIDAMEDQGIINASQPHSQVREVLDYGPVGPPAEDGM